MNGFVYWMKHSNETYVYVYRILLKKLLKYYSASMDHLQSVILRFADTNSIGFIFSCQQVLDLCPALQ